MPRGRPNRSGIDWSDPAAVAEHKRQNDQHHEYNREYSRKHPKPYKPRPTPHASPGAPSYGVSNGNAVLTEESVREMRSLYPARTMKALAELFGVSYATVRQIIHRETWKDVT
jgi:hypothetical protein